MTVCNSCCPLLNFLGCNVTKNCSYTFKFTFIDEADNYDITITPNDGGLYEIKYVKESNMHTVVGKIFSIKESGHIRHESCSCEESPAIIVGIDCSQEYEGNVEYIYAFMIRSIKPAIRVEAPPPMIEEEGEF